MNMEYRQLGVDGPLVSVIGFGTWPLGGRGYGPVDDAEAARAVARVLELGVTLFDTAPAYGNGYAEEFLGRVLAGQRNRVILVTKGGLRLDSGGHIVARDSSPATLLTGLEESLRRLRTDYVDLFLIHWPDRQTPWTEAMDGLNRILGSGKARFVGLSNFRAGELEHCRRYAPVVANQVAYNLFDRRWEQECFTTARALGIGIMAYSPLAHGLLSGRYTADHRFAPNDWRARGRNLSSPDLFVTGNFQQNLAVVERLRPLAEQRGLTIAQLALAWVLRDSLVATALTSPRRVDQVEESTGAAGVQLTAKELAAIDEAMIGAAGLASELPE